MAARTVIAARDIESARECHMKPESYARLLQADADLEERRRNGVGDTTHSDRSWDPYNTTGGRNRVWKSRAVNASAETNVSDTGLLRVLHAAFRNFRSSL